MQSPNEIAKFLKAAHDNLLKAEKTLIFEGNKAVAEIICSQRVRLETIISVHVADLAEIKAPKLLKSDPLEEAIYTLWMERHPEYGRPDDRDRMEVKRLIKDVIHTVYKQANVVFLESVLDNFEKSTAPWIIQNKSLGLFARHFRKLVVGPIYEFNSVTPVVSNQDSLQSVFAKR